MNPKKKKKKKAQLPFRTNIIFFIIFLMFSTLIFQLGVVQILNGEAFQEEIDRTIKDTTKIPVPRGKMYDRNGNLIVDNKPLYSITYTPPKGVKAQDRLELAEKLAEFIAMDSEKELKKITDRDKREYLYLRNLQENEGKPKAERDTYEDRIPKEQKEGLSNAQIYNLVLDSISEEEIADENFTKKELEIIRIKKELDKAYSLTPHIVKNENVTPEEYALVSENLDQLPGINATTDWERDYPFGNTIRQLLGNISSHEAGLPSEGLDYYLSKGYSRNDRVGTSGLEKQYEDVLRGRKEEIEYTTTKTGKVIDSKTVVKGERGKDLVLTIDMEFQKGVDKIVEEEILRAINLDPYNNRFLRDGLVVVMNPKTGELLAVSGKRYDRESKEFQDVPQINLDDAHMAGSVVKGATVLAGFQSGVISPGTTFYDSPITIKGTPTKRSFSRFIGLADDIKALKESSNVYMYYIALRMGGEYRYPFPDGQPAAINTDAWQEFRNYFHQFGLGVETGVDYPHESKGVEGKPEAKAGLLMDFGIGQRDTYTTMQLAQYVSTIANGGYRVRPHFVKEIREPSSSLTDMGPVYKSIHTEYLNKIEMSDAELARVQEGFRQAFQEPRGTAYRHFASKDYNAVGKTGTAESFYVENVDGKRYSYKTINRAMIGYAPMDDPEVAFAVLVPNIGTNAREEGFASNRIAERIMDLYFERKAETEGEAEGEEGEED